MGKGDFRGFVPTKMCELLWNLWFNTKNTRMRCSGALAGSCWMLVAGCWLLVVGCAGELWDRAFKGGYF